VGVTFNLKENIMDEFYILIIFLIGSTAAIIFYLFPWLDRRHTLRTRTPRGVGVGDSA